MFKVPHLKASKFATFLFVFLAFFLAGLQNSKLTEFKLAIEFIFLTLLGALLIKVGVSRRDLSNLSIIFFILFTSLFYLPLDVFLLNCKNYLYAFWSIIVLSRIDFDMAAIKNSLFAIALFGIIGIFFDLKPIFASIALSDRLLDKSFGIFLNFHQNAFLLGLIFLGYSSTLVRLSFFALILYLTNVRTPLLAFLFSSLTPKVGSKIIFCAICGVVVLILLFANPTIKDVSSYIYDINASAYVIFEQLANPESFYNAFKFFPGNPLDFKDDFMYSYELLNGAELSNEIGFLSMLNQYGLILTIILYRELFLRYRWAWLFIVASSLHYIFFYSISTYVVLEYFRRRISTDRSSKY